MDTVYAVLKMLGCLGMFLYGMSLMSGGLQKLAGNSLRSFLASMTSNRVKCVITGIVVTALVQSSTATTLMLVSFVNAGLLALANAIGVIMGANIGTTVTAWLFALSFDGSFSLGAIAIPMMFFAFLFMSLKRTKYKNFGEFIMGFGFLFLGLSTLKDTAYPILSQPAVQSFLAPLTNFGFGSIVLFMIIGACMTLMLQSSAATMSLTMLLVSVGVIPFEMAAAMVLGENIGTTITSNIAASVANVSAKRTARAHMLFNVFGVIWVLCLFRPFLKLIGIIVEALGFANPMTTDFAGHEEELAATLPYCVATLHTLFNLINTLILIWFIPLIEKIVKRLVPSPKGEEEVFKLKFIHGGPVGIPELSINEAQQEIVHFGEVCYEGYALIRDAVNEQDPDKFEEIAKQLNKYEEITDKMEFEIASYLNEISRDEISNESAEKLKSMYKIIGEMESLGDSGDAIGRLLKRKWAHKKVFDEDMLKRLNRMIDIVDVAYQVMIENLRNKHLTQIANAVDAECNINECRNNLREEHINNIEGDNYDYTSGVYYIDLVSELEKIGDFIINVSESKLKMVTKRQ
ncbi:MAG: Na/Pi cotransporter family protein [Bacteroidales bacterium]|nr:Na/Pi cotransporter family protein [Candidatus Cryptobacteroides caccocaballi]